jgi:hypothetical protein
MDLIHDAGANIDATHFFACRRLRGEMGTQLKIL